MRLLALAVLLAVAISTPLAASPGAAPTAAGSTLVDAKLDEEQLIERREEWFFSTRLDGVTNVQQMAQLRAAAMRETALRIQLQQSQRSAGTLAQENFWSSMGPAPSQFGGWAFGTVTGRVSSLTAHWPSGTLYAGTASGGVWRSTNDGGSWTPIFDSAGTLTIGTVAVDPNDPNVLWVGTGENNQGCESYFGIGLMRSGDGGANWSPRNGSGAGTLEDLSYFANVVIDPRNSSHIVTGGRAKGCSSGSSSAGAIWESNDAGLTWTKRLADLAVYEIQQDVSVRDTYWAATNKGIYKSTNNAVTWVQQTASSLPTNNTGRTELAIAPSNTQTVYALFQSTPSSQSEIWRTTNGGTSWTKQSVGSNACDGQCSYNMVMRVHQTDPNIVYRGTVHVFKSTDGAVNWTDLSNSWGSSQKVHQDTHEILMDPNNPESFFVGSDGGLWKSLDGGSSFVNKIGNMSLTQFYAVGVHPTDTGIICGGAQDNSSLARNGSNTWVLQTVTGDGFVCHIDPVNPNYAYITSYPGTYPNIYRSTTGTFGSFNVITGAGSGINANDRIDWVTPYLLDPNSPNILFLGTQRVYRSVDHGSNWSPVGPADMTGGSGDIFSLEIDRSDSRYVYAGTTTGRLWRSVDGGINWIDISTGLPSRSINDIAADPDDVNHIFAVVGGFNSAHLWEWTAGGGWVSRGGGLPNVPHNTVFARTGRELYVGGDTGVFKSTDGGVSFAPFMNGLPQGLVVDDLKYSKAQNLLTAGTYGRGAWQAQLSPVGPIVKFDSIQQPLVEVDGDHDGNVEPGETWSVVPVLRNSGDRTALGVSASLHTSTAGVTIQTPLSRSFGDIAAGATAAAASGFLFSVDPGFSCGSTISFDVVGISSSNAPNSYPDQLGAFTVTVVDHFSPPTVTTLLDEDFDPQPPSGWTHEKISPGITGCTNLTYRDEWKFFQKDAPHGTSEHCGNGPSANYQNTNYAWLYYGGKDSTNGPGIDVPSGADSATLTVVHWYNTEAGADGGQVAIDATEDNVDSYTTIVPNGGYTGNLKTGFCNGLEGKPAWSGASGGWITSSFDLTPYRGKKIYLAFIFGSDRIATVNEGWYVDQVKVESSVNGPPICQVTQWPGAVPESARFRRASGSTIEATWDQACNISALPTQRYSIQSGDLGALAASGSFNHAPIGSSCSRTSPSTFSFGAGNEYYLVIANDSGREGDAGSTSSGAPRPQTSQTCGARRVPSCP